MGTKNLFLKVGPPRPCRGAAARPQPLPPLSACRRSPICSHSFPLLSVLQDKKGRLYIVTALTDTKVDLKGAPGVSSQHNKQNPLCCPTANR